MMRSIRSRRLRTRLPAALIAGAAVSTLTLAPRSLVAPARGTFLSAVDSVAAPIFPGVNFGNPDVVLNIALFIPLGALVALLLPRRAWPLGMLAGFLLSASAELAQRSIPGRVPDADDVLWNTLGAVIGVVAIAVPRLVAHAVRLRRQRVRSTRT